MSPPTITLATQVVDDMIWIQFINEFAALQRSNIIIQIVEDHGGWSDYACKSRKFFIIIMIGFKSLNTALLSLGNWLI